MVKKFIISPPFGRYINVDWATPVKGTYTLHYRKGLIKQIITTLRPYRGGWVNRIGLRNCGIENVADFDRSAIYSLAAIERGDWFHIFNHLKGKVDNVELNIGCPNVDKPPIPDWALHMFAGHFPFISLKVPPGQSSVDYISHAYACGIRTVHICNTVPVPQGGLSGRAIKPYSLVMIEKVKDKHPNIEVIGGGGIYTLEDLQDYINAGADRFSLATVWFKPWRAIKFKQWSDSNVNV